jgi:two-component system sensor histidine kinase YesM
MKINRIFVNLVNDIPLNMKFLIIYIVCLLVPILVNNIFYYNRLLKNVSEREQNNYQISLDRTKSDIASVIEGCFSVSHSVSADRTLYSALNTVYGNTEQFFRTYHSTLRNRLNAYSDVYSYISSISIFFANTTMQEGGTYIFLDDDAKSREWYKALEASGQKLMLKAHIDTTFVFPRRQIPYLSVLRKLGDDSESWEQILKIDVDLGFISEILGREREYLDLYLLDNEDNIVCSSQTLYDYSHVANLIGFTEDMLPKDSLVLEAPLGRSIYLQGWRIIGVAKMERIAAALVETLRFVVPMVLASLFISSFLIVIIVRSYNYRLKRLSKQMLNMDKDRFDLIETNEGKDEIGGVIRNFNLMAAKINNLINDVYKLELQKKNLELERVRAELNYLQSQMNPHFLFNTLNALLVVSVKNGYTSITDVLKYLSKTLRRLLSWKDDLVTIEEELSFTEMYLKIEKFRFGEKFQYKVETDPALLKYKVPKMSLQPLVENACVHGIQAIKGVGRIEISITLDEAGLVVSVRDNGTGIDEDKRNELMRHIASGDDSNLSIGIRNVYRRLKLYYGDRVSFNIESKLKEGTRVYFTIPHDKLEIDEETT